MAGRSLAALLVLAAVGALLPAAEAQLAPVADRFLILTNPAGVGASWRMIQFIEQTLGDAGIDFDTVVFDSTATPRVDLSATFWYPNGTGKYRAYFMYPNLEAIGELTKAEVLTVWDYQQRTGARSAKWGVWVTTVGWMPKYDACGGDAQSMGFTNDPAVAAAGVPANAALSSAGLWKCPGNSTAQIGYCSIWANDFATTGIIPKCNSSQLVLVYDNTPSLGAAFVDPGVTGVIVKYEDGRESMAFVFDCAAWSSTCMTTAKVATSWMLAGGATPPPPPPPKDLQVDHRVLILTQPGFTNTEFMEKTLQGYGVPYTLVVWNPNLSPPPSMKSTLWNDDGSGKYSSFLMYPNLEAIGALNKSDIDVLWDYQKRTGARSVKFAAWPSNFGFNPNYAACGSDASVANFTWQAPLGVSGVQWGASFPLTGLYRCPGSKPALTTCGIWAADFASTGIIPGCTATSILETKDGVVGTLVKYVDNRESMAFMFDCASWSSGCMVVAHMAVGWMTQNLLPGGRDPLLTVQMDDFLLDTQVAGNDTNPIVWRVKPADLNTQISWQNAANSAWNANLKLELPYNGNGPLYYISSLTPLDVEDAGCADVPLYAQKGCNCWQVGYQACTSTDPYCQACTKDYPKPMGTGTDRVPPVASIPTASWTTAALSKDALANALITNANGVRDNFFFSHHTFTHENLDNATVYDANQQIALNILMGKTLGIVGSPTYSGKCMVTPQISGLVNGDTLTGLGQNGVVCAVGDNSWKHLRNNDNPHQMLVTTAANNGVAGFYILPRSPTEVYFNCTTPAQQVALYNKIYASYWGTSSKITDIMSREGVRVVRDYLLALRKDPFMMHQANMNPSTGKSLVQMWLEAVLTELRKYVTWPVRSAKLDDLMGLYLDRKARDDCQLSYRLTIGKDGTIKSLTATANGSPADAGATCTAPLIAADSATSFVTLSAPLGGAGGSAPFSLPAFSAKWSLPTAQTAAAGRRLLKSA